MLGWAAWRSCDGRPFRDMLRASLDTYDGLADRYDLDQLTELLLGAVTEAAEHVATSPKPGPTARSHAAQIERLIGAVSG